MIACSIRPARPEDAAAVAALSAHIWDGADYAPRRFDAWLSDRDGRFFVVVAEHALAGFGKLTRLRQGEWWLEGLRVHPGFRGRGLGRLLHRTGVALAEELATGALRFSTASTTGATQALAAETGFVQVGRYRPGWWKASEAGAESTVSNTPPAALLSRRPAWSNVSPGDVPGLTEAFRRHPAWSTADGLMLEGWRAYEILPRLAALAAAGRLVRWRGTGVPAILGWRRDQLRLNFAPLDQTLLPAFLLDLEEAMRRSGVARARVSPPSAWCGPEQEPPGWEWAEGFDLLLFARTLGSPIQLHEAASGATTGAIHEEGVPHHATCR